MFTVNKTRKVAATLAASALMFGALAVATPASAVVEPAPSTSATAGSAQGNLDPKAAGSVIIHKRTHNSADIASPDGSVPAPGSPIEDVEFRVTKLSGIDLNTNQGWETAADLRAGSSVTETELVEAITRGDNSIVVDGVTVSLTQNTSTVVTTNSSGIATANYSSNALGVYLIEEIKAPSSVLDTAAPFIVTLPWNNIVEGKGSWLYNLNVYPKNLVSTIKKSVNAPAQVVATTTVDFPVTVAVPTVGREKFTYFEVADNGVANFDGMSVSGVTLSGRALTEQADYVYANGVVRFTVAGLAQLDAAQEQDLVVTFRADIVNSVGELSNTASASFGSASESVPGAGTVVPEKPVEVTNVPETPAVQTNWGSFAATKVDAADTDVSLAGAEFSIFSGSKGQDGQCVAPETAPTVQPLASTTTAQDGVIAFGPLFVSDSNTVGDKSFNCYVLVETKAPVGFDNVTKPVALTITVGDGNTVAGGKISNAKSGVAGDIALPLTGAAGQLLMTLGGTALVAFALGLVIVRRKKNAEFNA